MTIGNKQWDCSQMCAAPITRKVRSPNTPISTLSGPHPADPRIMPPSNQHRQSEYDSDLASMSMERSYDAAIPTQGTADWLAWSTSGSFEVLYAWRRICYLSRDLERNNPHARAFLRELCLNVIGANGIRLQPRVKNLKGKNLNDRS